MCSVLEGGQAEDTLAKLVASLLCAENTEESKGRVDREHLQAAMCEGRIEAA